MPTSAQRPTSTSSIPPVPPLPRQIASAARIVPPSSPTWDEDEFLTPVQTTSLRELGPSSDDPTIASGRSSFSRGHTGGFDDLRLLAVSSQITEISYSISDIQTRIFEIQELRHRSHEPAPSSSSSNGRSSIDSNGSASTGVIDKALMQLDARLEGVSVSVSSIGAALDPLLRDSIATPTQGGHQEERAEEEVMIIRKYRDLVTEWESVQTEADVLRDELKEDKWLAVFRTVSEQADGMMTSLDKAVTQCQDFVFQVNRRGRGEDEPTVTLQSPQRRPVSLAAFDELQKTFDAKKKYYMPSTNKVIAVLDKGIRDRATKNGECLRKHADLRARWRALRDRINRTDADMAKTRQLLLDLDREPSEYGSVASDFSGSLRLGPSLSSQKSRTPSHASTSNSASNSALARSMSPIRKFAAKMTASVLSATKRSPGPSTPASKAPTATSSLGRPSLERQGNNPSSRRTSYFPFRSPQADQSFSTDTITPKSRGPKRTSSLAPGDEEMGHGALGGDTLKPPKPRWNISTKPLDPEHSPPTTHARSTPPTTKPRASRPPSASSRHPPTTQPSRSQTPSGPRHVYNSPSESNLPSRPSSRSQSAFGILATPRARPRTPSHIPAPKNFSAFASSASSQGSDDGMNHDTMTFSMFQSAFSPPRSTSPSATSQGGPATPFKIRRPSASHIPIPVFTYSGSRATSPSHDEPPVSPTLSATPSAASSGLVHPPTPESAPRSRTNIQHRQSSLGVPVQPRSVSRPIAIRGPPSSFKENSSYSSPPTFTRASPSRAGSRPGTALHDRSISLDHGGITQPYIPANLIDPLDKEVAKIVNSISHGLTIERIDPPLRTAPKSGEVRAQYAFSNVLARKVITCRLTITEPAEATPKKVMCRVGGGWMELKVYLQNRQAQLGL